MPAELVYPKDYQPRSPDHRLTVRQNLAAERFIYREPSGAYAHLIQDALNNRLPPKDEFGFDPSLEMVIQKSAAFQIEERRRMYQNGKSSSAYEEHILNPLVCGDNSASVIEYGVYESTALFNNLPVQVITFSAFWEGKIVKQEIDVQMPLTVKATTTIDLFTVGEKVIEVIHNPSGTVNELVHIDGRVSLIVDSVIRGKQSNIKLSRNSLRHDPFEVYVQSLTFSDDYSFVDTIPWSIGKNHRQVSIHAAQKPYSGDISVARKGNDFQADLLEVKGIPEQNMAIRTRTRTIVDPNTSAIELHNLLKIEDAVQSTCTIQNHESLPLMSRMEFKFGPNLFVLTPDIVQQTLNCTFNGDPVTLQEIPSGRTFTYMGEKYLMKFAPPFIDSIEKVS